MLKSITIENFFGFSEAQTIHLNPEVNVLVGINGSGKSNFIKAIRFLYEGAHGIGLMRLIFEEWGGFLNICNYNGELKNGVKLTYEFTLPNQVVNIIYEIIINAGYSVEEKIYQKDNLENTYLYLVRGNGFVRTFNFNANDYEITTITDGYILKDSKIIFNQAELLITQLINNNVHFNLKLHHDIINIFFSIKDWSSYSNFDTTINSIIRKPKPFSLSGRLLINGENIVQVLNSLQSNASLEYSKIEEIVREINPNFKNLHFALIGSFQIIRLMEKNLSRSVDMLHISDGTLRFLLLLSILYNPDRGTLVCLDEPEIGLHPDMINTIAEGIKYAAQTGTQMFIATHSPLLLNAFDLEDILIFEKDENNKSIVKTKSEEDFADWQGEFLAGQMWLRGQLGGTRW